MKPRLFWMMLLAFTLVIVLGVCGMLTFFGLAISGAWQPGSPRNGMQDLQRVYAEPLADYYVAHGHSWSGVHERLDQAPFGDHIGFLRYVLVDDTGRVVASSDRGWELGEVVPSEMLAGGTPVQVQSERVGTLLVQPGPSLPDEPGAVRRPPTIFWRVLRGFVFAGLGLAAVLLVLAVLFAQRLSRPLRDMTAAARALAAGDLDVRVRGASTRELDELSRAFNTMAQAIAQADRQRRQMTADIAHELRTPLTIIKGRLEGLQDGVYSATPDQVERLLSEVALLERLIDDLRLLALAEAGQLPLYPEALDLSDLLEDAQAAFAAQAAAQGADLQVEVPGELPQVNADPQRLAQVLANLVTNALRYTLPGGTVTLRAELAREQFGPLPHRSAKMAGTADGGEHRSAQRAPRLAAVEADRTAGHAEVSLLRAAPQTLANADQREHGPERAAIRSGGWVVIRVIDTGQGVAPEDLPHIFDRFWRADRSRARDSGGAGLGLPIARQIVAAHGGFIWAESEVQRGTTISIALPALAG